MSGRDVVELVLGDIDVWNIFGSPKKEVGKDHPVCGPVPDNHDIVHGVTQIEGLLDSPVNPILHADIAFSFRINIIVFVLFPIRINLRFIMSDFFIGHGFAKAAVDFIEFLQRDDRTIFLLVPDGFGGLDGSLFFAGKDEGDLLFFEIVGQGSRLRPTVLC